MQCESFTLRLGNKADLERLNLFLANVVPIQVSSALVQGDPTLWSVLVFYEGNPLPSAMSSPKVDTPKSPGLPQSAPVEKPTPAWQENPVFQALRTWRTLKAREEGVPPYVIATNAELGAIAERKPKTLEELAGVKGFGKLKLDKYGREVLEVLSHL
jgi:superfamily II DNA helicase RecQ